ncbi:non-ribosomal peptide synthetase, partial [Streptomyces ardesiacus]
LDTHAAHGDERRAATAPVRMEEFREKLVRFNGMYPGIDDDQVARYLNVYNHHRETAGDYAVPASPARVVLMQATAVEGEEADVEDAAVRLRAFWRRRVSGEFVVEPVACGHWDMLESEELPRVAAVLTAELHRLASVPARGETECTTPSGTWEER